jgi:hypothetical protein
VFPVLSGTNASTGVEVAFRPYLYTYMKQKTVFIYENSLLAERITGICLLYFYTQGCDEVNIFKEINLGE